MKSVFKDDSLRIPVKYWVSDLEAKADEQAKNLARLPFAFHHIAIMPDAHMGYGMPIGGVLATHGVIIPNAVGVDIGCGMVAAPLHDFPSDQESLKILMGKIRGRIPVGFDHQKEPQEWSGFDSAPDIKIIQQELSSAKHQLGTLGGGNHFIEIQRADDGKLWAMIHSGSRNFGLKIAKEYHAKALQLCDRWFSALPDKELAFLPIEEPEAKEYMAAMDFALSFAKENRARMIFAIDGILRELFGGGLFDQPIDVHHNYAVWENHFGKNVIIHRKGAIRARAVDIGIIPGSQGTASYITRGLGNADSFHSSSHGAGRKMGRGQATRELSLEDEKRKLDEQGIIHSVRNVKDLDEASGAYKDIEDVMANQADLAETVTRLRPLAVVKG